MTLRCAITALVMLAASAVSDARILVVTQYEPHNTGLADAAIKDYRDQDRRQHDAIVHMLDMFDVDYSAMPLSSVTTGFLTTGKVYYNRLRSVSAYAYDENGPSEQFDGVILVNGAGALPTGYVSSERNNPPWPRDYNGCYPCSMSVGGVTKAPRVPVLALFGSHVGQTVQATNGDNLFDGAYGSTARCTTGVSSYSETAFPSVVRSSTGGGNGQWLSSANLAGFIPNATPPTGGFRPWLRINATHAQRFMQYNGINANNADSVMAGAGVDSLTMWERPFTGLYAGAGNTLPIKPFVWANIMGASPCNDSSAASLNRPCEYDAVVLLAALARLDTLTSGGVFRKRHTAAIVISGAFERTQRRLPGGANNADSTVIKACIDSLAANGVPVTVTVNVDSVETYPNELAWWTGKGLAVRFAPVATIGVSDTTALAASANWSITRPVDVFGRFRARAFYGDSASLHTYTSGGSDSSIYQGLLYLKRKATRLGLLPLSSTIIAPMDDWSPKNMLSKSNALDSLMRVFRLAGYSAALVDVQRPEANINRIVVSEKDRVRGWYGVQRTHYNRLSGEDFRFVGHTGYGISGGAQYFITTGDSTAGAWPFVFGGGGPTSAPYSHQALSRFWSGFAHDKWRDFDWFQTDGVSLMGGYLDVRIPSADLFNDFRRANVWKFHVSDLSGNPNGPPARPGWWAIKSLNNQFRAINRIAGRTVVSLGFPEDIEL